ncbi:MAG: GTP cyclohydrolase I FolE2 [Eubacterium sp.]|nr:GTP cyclohydrolase I FolE2 [Eubacterium sp.]
MKDVQKQIDTRGVYLDQVGIKDFVFPIEIRNRNGEWISTAATMSLFVGLSEEQKGTHMSRFVEVVNSRRRIDLNEMKEILLEMCDRLEAKNSFINLDFDYFIEKKSPVTHIPSMINVKVEYSASLIDGDFEFDMKVVTPVTTLCPCSKEISDYSAHNQRADVSIKVRRKKFIWIEELVEIAESAASSPVYSLLKRPDEKFVTEYAYDNPRFVEDVAREVKLRVDKLEDIRGFCIEVESMESIHNHSAYACVRG